MFYFTLLLAPVVLIVAVLEIVVGVIIMLGKMDGASRT